LEACSTPKLFSETREEFLRVSENQNRIVLFLGNNPNITTIVTGKHLITTIGSDVFTINREDLVGLTPCTHEEANTPILLNLCDAVQHGFTKAEIRTEDADVVVLAILASQHLKIEELWVAFGVGKHYRVLSAHDLAISLGPDRCVALSLFHTFTGCDIVSFFSGRGKRTAWNTLNANPEITSTFMH